MKSLENALEPSIRAAMALGPNTGIPTVLDEGQRGRYHELQLWTHLCGNELRSHLQEAAQAQVSLCEHHTISRNPPAWGNRTQIWPHSCIWNQTPILHFQEQRRFEIQVATEINATPMPARVRGYQQQVC